MYHPFLGLVVVPLVAFLIFWWMCRKEDRKRKKEDDDMYRSWRQDENWRKRH